jgi:hypothetical protein
VHPLGLAESEQADLVAFLEALTSPLEFCEALPRLESLPAAQAEE